MDILLKRYLKLFITIKIKNTNYYVWLLIFVTFLTKKNPNGASSGVLNPARNKNNIIQKRVSYLIVKEIDHHW